MAKIRFLALAMIAFAIGVGSAQARDSSDCAGSDPAASKAVATGERCPEVRDQKAKAPGQPVLHDDAAAITRAQHFVYRLLRPEMPSGETIVLLHGSGGNEASLFKLAQHAAPDATLLGVRGRIVQKGIKRWYARVTPTEFDQADIRAEARAFVVFLKETMAAEKLDLDRTVFIGYSNGANLIAALTLLYPDLVHRAVLLRAMPVLDEAPATDLQGARFLNVAGGKDEIYAPFAPALESLLRDRGAIVDSSVVSGNHYLGDEDVKIVGDWLKASNAVAGGTP